LAVLFPDESLLLDGYHRVITDVSGQSSEEIIKKISEAFDIEEGKIRPEKKHSFGMYLDGKEYILTAKEELYAGKNVKEALDVSILQENVFAPFFDIKDPRTDNRIEFIGETRGLPYIKNRADETKGVAFILYPVATEDIFGIADAGEIMPPKSTWFVPKIISGLFMRKF
jgi:uncharacterized protein (DUF1015 family)